MSRPSRVTPEEVTVTFPEPSELHPVPLVTWVGTTRSVVPEGTPALDQVPTTGVVVGVGLGLGAGDVGLGVGVTVAVGVVGLGVGVTVVAVEAVGEGLTVGTGVFGPCGFVRVDEGFGERYDAAEASSFVAEAPCPTAWASPPEATTVAAPANVRTSVRATAPREREARDGAA
jgi:hypothetical protein